jgi:glucose-6-phosphate isomerase
MNMTLSANAGWQRLTDLAASSIDWRIADLFAQEPQRIQSMSAEGAGLFLDFSKNAIDAASLGALLALPDACGVAARRQAMFAGSPINVTEHRPVLHVALREPAPRPEVAETLQRMNRFAQAVRAGDWKGDTGEAIRDVVHIGIGGSHLGPELAVEALRPYGAPQLNVHFVANVDGHALHALLPRLDARRTLFIVASKTFTTLETMMNARTARDWHAASGGKRVERHFVALSTNLEETARFGIPADNVFPFWDWVGGRYSVWSAIGLPLMLAIGPDHFRRFLAGAHAMDRHFLESPWERNLPTLLALVGIWNRNARGHTSLCVAPYDERLRLLPAYLQQLDMESNGKSVTTEGTPATAATAPVIWGQAGTNGQHAFFQMLHQGTDIVPVDFIACEQPHHPHREHHRALLANCFAQSEAMMRGKTEDEAYREMRAKGMDEAEARRLAPHRRFPGNRPSNTLLLPKLDPESFGALLALYEHKVFVQGAIWGVNSFDQWGVELGKVLAQAIDGELAGDAALAHDPSTNQLVERIRKRTANAT